MLVMEMGRKAKIEHLAFAPDGRSLAAASPQGVFLWRTVADGARAERIVALSNAHAVRFTADGRRLFVGANELWSVDPNTGACRVLPVTSKFPPSFARFDLSPTGQHVLVGYGMITYAGGRTRLGLWRIADASPTEKVWEREMKDYCYSFAPQFLADGARFARLEPVRGFTHRVAFYDTAGAFLSAREVEVSAPREWLLAPHADRFALRDATQIDVFPLDPQKIGEPVTLRSEARKHFTGMAFHPSGRYLAAASNDHTVTLIDTATGAEAQTFTWQLGRMRSVCFSSDGTLAAAGSDKGQAVVWDVDL